MKPVSVKSVGARPAEAKPVASPKAPDLSPANSSSLAMDEGLVMVLFPAETWAKVQAMGVSRGVSPAEVVSVALELLDERMKNGA